MQSCYKFLWETYLVRWRLAALSRTEVVICASQISASCPSIGQLQEMEGGGDLTYPRFWIIAKRKISNLTLIGIVFVEGGG